MAQLKLRITLIVFLFLGVSNANAEIIGGIDFPDGALSFADSVITYDSAFGGGNVPTDPNFTDPSQALGVPDYANDIGSVSLGAGGLLILKFTDNRLTGSDNSDPDLHVFEIGPDVEDTFVAISKDGTNWTDIGKVFGSTSSIDIDQFGFDTSDEFSYVRLIDDINEGNTTGGTVGADIDAVGAISTVAAPVPLPGALGLFAAGIALLRLRARS